MNEHEIRASTPRGENTIALFLGLYLLVLAFFIVLVSISTPENVKSKSVMDSLSSTFASILPPSTELTPFAAREGDVVALALQSDVQGLFTTAIQVAKVEIVNPGRLMRVHFPSASLFFPNTAELREGQVPLLDRIVATLSAAPPGMRHDMEFIIGARYAETGLLPAEGTLSIRRASVFASELAQRGAPPGSIAIGLRPGDPEEIVLWFHVRRPAKGAEAGEDSGASAVLPRRAPGSVDPAKGL